MVVFALLYWAFGDECYTVVDDFSFAEMLWGHTGPAKPAGQLRCVDEQQPLDAVGAHAITLVFVFGASNGIILKHAVDIVKYTQLIREAHGGAQQHPAHAVTSPGRLEPAVYSLSSQAGWG